jgi:hypothetical protein
MEGNQDFFFQETAEEEGPFDQDQGQQGKHVYYDQLSLLP